MRNLHDAGKPPNSIADKRYSVRKSNVEMNGQGGVKAVIWTDVVQALVMVFAITMVLVCAVVRIGGVGETVARATDGDRLVEPL